MLPQVDITKFYDSFWYYFYILKNKMVELYYKEPIEDLTSTFIIIDNETEAHEIDVSIDESVEITYDQEHQKVD